MQPITYREIARALAKSPTNSATLATLVYRTKRTPAYLHRAILEMVLDGYVTRSGPPSRELFELVALDIKRIPKIIVEPDRKRGQAGKPKAPPAPKPAAVDQVDDQADAEDGESDREQNLLTFEQQQAAKLWAERMGDQRWRYDPRCDRDRRPADNLKTPFTTIAARDA